MANPTEVPPGVNVKLDIDGILNCLPHRAPFLMVDRVTGVRDQKLYGYKNVSINEPYFQGHFPDKPVMPGVLQIEALGQMGAIFGVQASGLSFKDTAVLMLGVDNVRFRRMVIPGDRLDMSAWLIKKRGPIWRMGAEGNVDGQPACECEIMAWIGPREQAPKNN